MANRRMFSKTITSSARFLKMPQEAQNLYFHLCMNADDDGVVEAFTIMNMLGSSEDVIRILNAKKLVRVLNEDMVTYITDWNEHNLIRADRKVNSVYRELLLKIVPEAEMVDPKPRADTGVIPRQFTGRPLDGIGKDRIGEVRIGQIGAPASQEAHNLIDDSSVEPDEENTPTRSLSRQGAIKSKGYDPKLTISLLRWAEGVRGSRFGNPLKQKRAISIMLSTGRTVEDIQKKWSDMKTDPYWSVQGFDFATLSSQFDKTKGIPKKDVHVAEMLELK